MLRLIGFALLLAVGQLLFKKASEAVPDRVGLDGQALRETLALALNPYLIGALALYFLATLLWIWVLRDVPLSRAYPFIGLGFVLVPLGALLFFQEPITGRYLLGSALIMAGIYLAAAPQA